MLQSPWLRAARLQLHTIGFTPLLLGNVAAWYEQGVFSWPRLIVSMLIGLFLHIITAFVNDLADVGTDGANLFRTPFSGGSGVVVEGQLTRADLAAGAAGLVFLSLALTCVLIFMLHVHRAIALFVGWGLLSAVEYSLPPVKLAYRGGGEFLVLVTYSLALVWAGYFIQAGFAYSPLIWVFSAPIGLAVFTLITVTQFPDREADAKAGKRSLVILFGEKTTLRICALAVMLGIAGIVTPVLTGFVPVWAGVLSLLASPLAYRLVKTMLRPELEGMPLYMNLSQGALLLTLWFGLAPAAGLILQRLLGMKGLCL